MNKITYKIIDKQIIDKQLELVTGMDLNVCMKKLTCDNWHEITELLTYLFSAINTQ